MIWNQQEKQRAVKPATIATLGALCALFWWSTPLSAQNELRLDRVTIAAENLDPVSLLGTLTHDVLPGVGGFSFGLEPSAGLTLSALQSIGPSADFSSFTIEPGGFALVGVIFSISSGLIVPPGEYPIFLLEVETSALSPGDTGTIEFVGNLGTPPIAVEFATPAGAVSPATTGGEIVRELPLGVTTVEPLLWYGHEVTGEVGMVRTTSVPSFAASVGTGGSLVAVSVAPDASVWFSDAAGNQIERVRPVGGLPFTDLPIPLSGSPGPLAHTRSGDAWVGITAPPSLIRLSPGGSTLLGPGGQLGEAVPLPGVPRAIAVDRGGNAWVATNGSDAILKVAPSGGIAFEIPLPGTSPSGLALDRSEAVWLSLESSSVVERRSSDGALIGSWNLTLASNPTELAVRYEPTAPGEFEVWAAGLEGLARLRLPSGSTPDEFPLADASGVSIDGLGRVWATDSGVSFTYLFDPLNPAGFNIAFQAVGVGATIGGDGTGYNLVNVLFPGDDGSVPAQDFDGDGSFNREELEQGTDPFDPLSFPAAVVAGYVAPISNLRCDVAASSSQLSWTNGDPGYDSIRVRRLDEFGAELEVTDLAGDAEEFQSSILPDGAFRYEVSAFIGTDQSEPATCVVAIGPGQPAGSGQVSFGTSAANLNDLTRVPNVDLTDPQEIAYYATDAGNGQIYGLNGDFELLSVVANPLSSMVATTTGIAFDPAGDLGDGSLFVAGGGAGQAVEVWEIDLDGGEVLEQWVVTQGAVPLTGRPGGLAYSPLTEHLLVIGPIGCEVFAFSRASAGLVDPSLSLTHPTPSPAGFTLTGVDVPAGTQYGPGGGTVALTIAVPPSSPTVDQQYAIGIYEVDALGGLTLTSEIPLVVLEGENTIGGIAVGSSSASVVGVSTSTLYEILVRGEASFSRGDCNTDGTFNIADPIALLGELFTGATPSTCPDACDSNDSGGIDIADPISMLANQFSGGPPPAGPFPSCGPDPTGDALDCPSDPSCP